MSNRDSCLVVQKALCIRVARLTSRPCAMAQRGNLHPPRMPLICLMGRSLAMAVSPLS